MSDLERVLAWTSADERFLDRVTADMDPDRRAALKAIVETRGEPRALAQRLAPEVAARLRARAPEPLAVLAEPLAKAWSPPPDLAPEELAQRFLERYGARLDELTGHATKAAAAAAAAAAAIGSAKNLKELNDAIVALEAAIREASAAASACAHPEGSEWSEHAREVAREGADVVDAARKVRTLAATMRSNLEAIERSLRAWAEAPVAERAVTAEGMAVHLRAASLVVADMKDEIAALAR